MDYRYILTTEEIDKFILMGKIKEYDEGAVLFYEKTPADFFYIILEGLVKGGRFEGNKERIFHFFFPSMMVGEVSFREQNQYPLSAVFVTKGKVILINREAMHHASYTSSVIDDIFIRSIIGKVRYLQNSINIIASSNAKLKTAIFLLEHQYWLSNISIKEMASVLNSTRETISRSISFFIQINALKKMGSKIKIINPVLLEAYIASN